MKKKVVKKLGLSRETLRVLDELDKVAGGTTTITTIDITQSWPFCHSGDTCNSGDVAC